MHVTSANFRSALTRGCFTPCAISCSTKKSQAHSISPRAKLTRKLITETEVRFTGTWSASSAPITAGGEIYFDGKLIRKDGEFLPKELRTLNWR